VLLENRSLSYAPGFAPALTQGKACGLYFQRFVRLRPARGKFGGAFC
jgi:hypothetical protein